MKRILLSLLLVAGTQVGAFAQGESDCFTKWAVLFEKRGAEPVPDGEYENAIISIRKILYDEETGLTETIINCYAGKAVVEGSKVTGMFLRLVDNSYEKIERDYKYNIDAVVENGISKTRVTKTNELINVIFPDKLKPKKQAYQEAPPPPQFSDEE
ncbi:MAG: hypothetical protein H6585_12180 [Flavobacteriales bacterium]|nr:hypothetical protein [Flavobacteriales bacterium]MCB9449088.1 hypothetical protein [Flavobacteriales bacterium]